MTEGSDHIAQPDFEELESAAVAGAVAVQKLIADRNSLREQLAASLAAQDDLKRRLRMLHQRYIELARKVVSSMQYFDATMRQAMGERPEGSTEGTDAKRQFDGDSLPVQPQPNGNGLPNGRAQLEA
jgi:hypothetical protein